jgi:pimeloyl-ACP methyl ester carboxylesterase
MTIVICPGVHPSAFTESFIKGLDIQPHRLLVFPTDRYPAYSTYHLVQFLRETVQDQSKESLLLIGFSAGAVAAVGAAAIWQLNGRVKAVIALDGWGVPQLGSAPLYRLSHDAFTAWSSACLGGQPLAFYADPAVAHLELWRSPQTAQGWGVQSPKQTTVPTANNHKAISWLFADRSTYHRTTAAQFLRNLLRNYREI